MNFKGALLAIAVLTATHCFAEPDPFAENIRKTEPLTPEAEADAFHVPYGFQVQLVASEPDIGKPMNLAFDSKGRLWATISREYPFPVLPVEKPGRDRIVVMEDFDENGRAHKFTTFQTGLNIPIGLYPYKDGVIGFSIPKIHYFGDPAGLGQATKDTVLLSGFGYQKDTHGLTSNFKRGYDGFIYANHGFQNDSTVVGTDGSTITMNSGNCYRFRPDGTQVELHSHGQVNPFGLMFDPLGDLWSADCHSKPTYELMHGGYYPSFGKPHDGLGFGPEVCMHSHGSTAIAGMVFYDDDQWPEEYHWNTFIGNVMTCKINRDSYVQHGSTRIAKEEPDFLTSEDPWFRPVNLEFGPDGAMYVADFYNRIIGHYEVPLDHPGRDRERGRIWRIVYKKDKAQVAASPKSQKRPQSSKPLQDLDLTKFSTGKLVSELAQPNIRRRMMAADQLVDRVGQDAVASIAKMMQRKNTDPHQRLHGLWVLWRLGALSQAILQNGVNDENYMVRTHAMRILAEMQHWTRAEMLMAYQGMLDVNPFVQRAAADAVARHPQVENIPALLRLRETQSDDDAQLVYMSRIALRNQLLDGNMFSQVVSFRNSEDDQRVIADVCLGIKTNYVGSYLLSYVINHANENKETGEKALPRDKMQAFLKHVARYAPETDMDQFAAFTRKQFKDDVDFQLTLFKSVQEGFDQRGSQLPDSMKSWGHDLAHQLIVSVDTSKLEWRNTAVKNTDVSNPWVLEKRESSDGKKDMQFISSLAPGGESLTGILRSRTFKIPESLTFYFAGHDGSPDKPLAKKNYVRLIDASNNKVIKSAQPPRNDIAQKVTWDLKNVAGKKGYLEIIDRNAGHSYAWLAVGRFNPEVVPMPKIIPNQVDLRQRSAAELAATLKIADLEKPLDVLFRDKSANPNVRSAAAKSLLVLNANEHGAEVGKVLADVNQPQSLREGCARGLVESKFAGAAEVIAACLATAPQNLQMQLALALASKSESAETLLKTVEAGKASRRLLLDKTLKERLAASKPSHLDERLETLTKGLPTADAERQKLIDQRISSFNARKASAKAGVNVFNKNCAACHSLDGRGATIGPQLDGVGNRGSDRIIEDVLDPSRNVDPAFRVTLFVSKDGDVESGLFRREEGKMVVYADSNGKEHSVAKTDLQERRPSQLSLMPDNFGQAIASEDFNNLVAYLLSKGRKDDRKK